MTASRQLSAFVLQDGAVGVAAVRHSAVGSGSHRHCGGRYRARLGGGERPLPAATAGGGGAVEAGRFAHRRAAVAHSLVTHRAAIRGLSTRAERGRRAGHVLRGSLAQTAEKPEAERAPLPDVRAAPPGVSLADYDGDALIIGVCASPRAAASAGAEERDGAGAGAFELPPEVKSALGAARLGGAVSEMVAEMEFTGKKGSSVATRVVMADGGKAPRRIALYGLGEAGEVSADTLYKFGQFVSSNLLKSKNSSDGRTAAGAGERVGVAMFTGSDDIAGDGAMSRAQMCKLTAEGVLLGAFVDDRFKSSVDSDGSQQQQQQRRRLAATVEILDGDEHGIRRGAAVAGGVILTKQMVNAPANVATPAHFAETAERIARESGGAVTCSVLEREDCEKMGMGAFLGVAQGSDLPPKFVHLKYTPPMGVTDATKRVCVVGKGVTHDTGGYNLKGSGSMIELMKFDCGGACACLGAMKAVSTLQPAGVELSVVMACCENMISGKAYHPGDIVTASNKKTIEVLNTDAEGRLTLADALLYAQRQLGPLDALIDVATLTGAVMVALGNEYSGMWSSHDALAARIEAASRATGERFWRMPLAPEYRENIKGKISDLKNIGGGRFGGAITAALFLQEFVESKVPWAHLDIAGTVWSDKGGGATGVPTRTLVELVERFGERSGDTSSSANNSES